MNNSQFTIHNSQSVKHENAFVIATNNAGKLREMRDILSKLGIDAMSLAEAGVSIEVEETGVTFKENAFLKAQAVCEATGRPSIADDSGLVADALGGEPGVYSSSFGGDGLSDKERCAYLLQKMENTEQRSAKFVCNIVCVYPDGKTLFAEGKCHGEISAVQRGADGFGYDPVFLVNGTGKTMAELTSEEKNNVSHRALALKELSRIILESDSH